jgi:UDP-glucose 4-epimerase
LNQLVATMSLSLHKTIRKIYLPARTGDIVKSAADIEHILSTLSFNAQYSLTEGLKLTYESLARS